jgi:hypothetical protein
LRVRAMEASGYGRHLAGLVGGLVALAGRVELWEAGLVNDTVLWFLTAALVLLVNSHKIAEERGALWRVARQAIGFTVLVEAFANLFVLPLLVELVLLPVAAFVSMALVVAESEEEYAPAARIFSAAQVLIGLLILSFVVAQLAGLGDADWDHVWRALVLPIWLTLGTLPLICALGVLADWERQILRRRLRQAL